MSLSTSNSISVGSVHVIGYKKLKMNKVVVNCMSNISNQIKRTVVLNYVKNLIKENFTKNRRPFY